jgi:large repetitive protein
MDNIVVADKQSAVATQNAWGNITLNSPGVVQMPVAPDQVATVTRRGQDLIVTLKSGEKVTVGHFFAVDQAGVGSDMVFVGEDGTLWHANYDAQAFTGFTFEEVASLDELVAGIGVAGAGTSTFAIAGLSLLGVGGVAAAANHSSGGGSDGGGSTPGDTTPPATPIDLLVSPDGLRLSGRGEAGTTVNVFDSAGNLIGSGTVNADGSFDIALNTPQANGENLNVTLTDAAGNTSQPGAVTAPDITPRQHLQRLRSTNRAPPSPVAPNLAPPCRYVAPMAQCWALRWPAPTASSASPCSRRRPMARPFR